MVQAQKDFKTIYFKTPREASKFLKASTMRVRNCIWLNSDMNNQAYSYSGFKLKKRGEHECAGWILTEVDISEEEAALRNAMAGYEMQQKGRRVKPAAV